MPGMKRTQTALTSFFSKGSKPVHEDEPPAKRQQTTAIVPTAADETPSPFAVNTASAPTFDSGNVTTAALNEGLIEFSDEHACFQPFAKPALYICPYRAKGKCHIASTYEENPFEDGTLKIPCQRKCGQFFVSHQKACQHAKIPRCTGVRHSTIPCYWDDCPFVATGDDPEKQMANHIRHKHSKDSTSSYQCSKCAVYYHNDLYKLAMHEERCTGETVAKESNTTMRFKLNNAAQNNEPARFIIVLRSSNRIPEGWKANTDNYRDGLPILGKKILAHFAAKTGNRTGAAFLHAANECPTRRVPALTQDLSYRETENHQKSMVWRGFKFTEAIVNDIKAANQAGIKPIVISQGIDGFFCDVRMILPWLRATRIDFEPVIKKEPGHDLKVDELAAAWKLCQES
ncbi:hypothetical protein OPT61_g9188 [Boeremia exigua]|uniref:Uncharacterized protein n=1 Tax=Boeremia exigua TaxID=749465 RepID=A0ACC2HWR2_9PLEO|nr:hypothetical protein OPT61_g9188 [Boeremia exigua]